MQIKKYTNIALASAFLISLTFGIAQAADFRIADKEGGNVDIEQNEIIKNLYSAGNIVSVNADTEKGLHVAGNIVNINGKVGNSVYSGANTLTIRGDVEGSVHGAGSEIIIESNIQDDVILGGENIFISNEASIGGDFVAGGKSIDIQGSIGGDIYLSGETLVINGEVDGDIKIGQISEFKIGSDAVIKGNINYYSTKEIEIAEGATILGEVILKENGISKGINRETLAEMIFAFISIGVLVKLLGTLLIAFVLFALFGKFTGIVVKENLSSFWKNLGIGLALLILTPIAVVILMATIIGIWFGVIILLVYFVSVMIATIFASITFGSWINSLITKDKKFPVTWKTIIGGIFALTIVSFIPFIGSIVAFAFLLSALGSIYGVTFGLYNK